jgi:hypothetical protein
MYACKSALVPSLTGSYSMARNLGEHAAATGISATLVPLDPLMDIVRIDSGPRRCGGVLRESNAALR